MLYFKFNLKGFFSMLRILQMLISLLLIVIIIPQTPTENVLLRKALETGYFTSYTEAKDFLNRLTWALVFVFLGLTYVLSIFM